MDFFAVNICAFLMPPLHARKNSEDFLFGATVQIECDYGYSFGDGSFSVKVECLGSGVKIKQIAMVRMIVLF